MISYQSCGQKWLYVIMIDVHEKYAVCMRLSWIVDKCMGCMIMPACIVDDAEW